jgi:hypothetical protein
LSQNTVTIPKVFISYSWSTPEHEEWVIGLATRLRQDGVDVVLDKWDLKEGQDIYAFMESMVTSSDIDKVLIICDKSYKEKADSRKGGVGTETQIITSEIYNSVNQEKFIPIIAERDEKGDAFIPTYIRNRKYIDLSSDDLLIENYEILLRNLYNRPQHRKPKLGNAPSYLFNDEEVSNYKFEMLINQIEKNIGKNESMVKSLITDFANEFIDILEDFQIDNIDDINNADELIMSKINDMTILRDSFVKFIETTHSIINSDLLLEFFENLYNKYQSIRNSVSGRFYEIQWDHYAFFIRELFVYAVMVLINKQKFEVLGEFLRGTYFIKRYSEIEPTNFSIFDCYLKSLEEIKNKKYEQATRQRKYSMLADVLINRATLKKYTKDKIVEAEYLLYYISCMLGMGKRYWFPRSYVYTSFRKLDFFERLKSRRYFEKCKPLFGYDSLNEFKEAVKNLENPYNEGFLGLSDSIPPLTYHISPDEIGSLN